jgi:hypothetical protein
MYVFIAGGLNGCRVYKIQTSGMFCMSESKTVTIPACQFISENWLPYTRIIPATEIGEWVNRHILSGEGRLHNPDHEHLTNALADADIAFMWASSAFAKKAAQCWGSAKKWLCAPEAGRSQHGTADA